MKSTFRMIGMVGAVIGGFALLATQRPWQVGADLPDGPDEGSTPAPAAGAEKNPGSIRFMTNPQPVQEFTVADIEGRPLSSADWRNTVTIVNFWATWCLPCLDEIPDFIALQDKYRDHLQIVGFSLDEGPADQVRRFVQEHRINYRVAITDPDLGAKFGGVLGLPTSFVLDQQGRVVQRHIGLVDPAVYEQEVRALAGLPLAVAGKFNDGTRQMLLTDAAHAARTTAGVGPSASQ